MAVVTIDTAEEFLVWRKRTEPAYVHSRVHGRLPVPCMNTILVRRTLVIENLYNPNSVPPDKMELLRQSIVDNGVCFPLVTIWDDDQQHFVVIDGAHRNTIQGAAWLDCDYVPIVVLPHNMSKRLAATWQFNKARGQHQVDLDADLIRRLADQGLDDAGIAAKLGVDVDTVFRYRQVAGIAEVVGARAEWSRAWEMVEDDK